MLSSFNWLSFAIGIVFAMFVLPWLLQLVGGGSKSA